MDFVSAEANYVLQFINQTHRSVFLTGKAGTGKTTILKEIIQTTHKNTAVVAPTGIAALNAGGVTIHSLFQLPFGGFIPDNSSPQFLGNTKFESRATLRRHFKMSGLKKAVIRNLELLIIDEVSMLRSDLLDAIDFMLQSVRKINHPFGGVQLLFIGDLLQLPPVVKDEEWRILRNYYKGKFFFNAHVIEQNPPLYIELSKIFRQTDDLFISILNNLRNNQMTAHDVEILNQQVQPNFDLKNNKGFITLTTHNAKADEINMQSLNELDAKSFFYKAEIIDEFPDKIFPLEEQLELKVGSQIMFIKNDISIDKKFFNGKMGTVKTLSENEILVHFPEENKTIEVEKYEWQNIRYTINENTKEIEEEVVGTFTHYPIKLAWAITVHKSQGLTFDKAALDVSQVFLPGQAYVAFSRLRSLQGLVLLSPLQMNGISNDQDVMEYATNKASEEVLSETLQKETQNYIHQFLVNRFDCSNLAKEWRNHSFSYNNKSDVSNKSKSAIWAKKQLEEIENLAEPSRKFILQLNKLFSSEVDLQFVNERIQAAYNYFFQPMDDLVGAIFWRLEEVKRHKKMKTYYEELLLLEELQVKGVLGLMRAKLLMEIVLKGDTISKQNLTSEEIKNYRILKKDAVAQAYKEANINLLEDEKEANLYEKKSKKKEPKKSTIIETYELWIQRNSIKEIASIRKLTPQTICNHLSKLIESQTITINEVLPEDKINELALAFKEFKGETLSELKEQLGEAFTWDELRLFRASL
jgi:hypothetical protein